MIELKLSKGQITFIDEEDADLANLKWSASERVNQQGYYIAKRNEQGKNVFLHRVILSRKLGRPLLKTELVDHINLNPLHNWRSNLRLATHSQNAFNQPVRKNNSSGYKGVSWHSASQTWQARIRIGNGVRLNQCGFPTPEEAYQQYCEWAKIHHDMFKRI